MRKSWDAYFMEMARVAASRSTCLRRQVGAVAVSPDNRILGTGYNGALPGTPHCEETGCLRQKLNIPPENGRKSAGPNMPGQYLQYRRPLRHPVGRGHRLCDAPALHHLCEGAGDLRHHARGL